MSATTFNLYDGETAPAQHNTSQAFGDLFQFVSDLQIPNVSRQTRSQPRNIPDTSTTGPHAFPVATNPATMSAPKAASRSVPNDLLFKPDNHHHGPYTTPENPDFEEPKDVSCIQLARDKLRSWLARPETAALKRLVSGRRRRTVSAIQERPKILFSPIAVTIGPDTPVQSYFPQTRTTSVAYPDDLPLPYAGDKVIVVQEITTHRDSLPPTQRRRAISFSPGATLPTPPLTQSRDTGFDNAAININPSKPVVTPPPDAMLGPSRLRKPRPISECLPTLLMTR
jgi:hypothetical protein